MVKGLFWGLFVLFVVLVILFLIEKTKRGGIKALMFKTYGSAVFIMISLVALAMNRDNLHYGLYIIAGQIFGIIGDIWLDLKYVHKEYSDEYTFAGIYSFSIGHIFYIIAILGSYLDFVPWQIVLAILCAIAAVAFVRFLGRNKPYDYGKFNKIIPVYSVITMLTVTLSLNAMNIFVIFPMSDGVDTSDIFWKYVVMFVATALFSLSDFVLSHIYFLKGGNTKSNVVINHLLYSAAQFMISLSIAL